MLMMVQVWSWLSWWIWTWDGRKTWVCWWKISWSVYESINRPSSKWTFWYVRFGLLTWHTLFHHLILHIWKLLY